MVLAIRALARTFILIAAKRCWLVQKNLRRLLGTPRQQPVLSLQNTKFLVLCGEDIFGSICVEPNQVADLLQCWSGARQPQQQNIIQLLRP